MIATSESLGMRRKGLKYRVHQGRDYVENV